MKTLMIKHVDILPELKSVLNSLERAGNINWESDKDKVRSARSRLGQLIRLMTDAVQEKHDE